MSKKPSRKLVLETIASAILLFWYLVFPETIPEGYWFRVVESIAPLLVPYLLILWAIFIFSKKRK